MFSRGSEECRLLGCGAVNRRFGGTYRLYLQSRKFRERGVLLTAITYRNNVKNEEFYLLGHKDIYSGHS
jgi:hypothetical protein